MRLCSRPTYSLWIFVIVLVVIAFVGCGEKRPVDQPGKPGTVGPAPPGMAGPGGGPGGGMPGPPGMAGPGGGMPGGPGMAPGMGGPGGMPGGRPGMPGGMAGGPGMGAMGGAAMGGGMAAPAPAAPSAPEITAGDISAPPPQPAEAVPPVEISADNAKVVRDAAALLRASSSQRKPPPLATEEHNVPPLALSMALTKVAQITRGLDLYRQRFFHEYWALLADEVLGDVKAARTSLPAKQLIMAAQERGDWEPFFWRWALAEMLAAENNARLQEIAVDVAKARVALALIRRLVTTGVLTQPPGDIVIGVRTDASLNHIAEMITQALRPSYDPALLKVRDNARSPLMVMLADNYLCQGRSWWWERSCKGPNWPPQPTADWVACGFLSEQIEAVQMIKAHKLLNWLHSGLLPTVADVEAYAAWLEANPPPEGRPKLSEQFAELADTEVESTIRAAAF